MAQPALVSSIFDQLLKDRIIWLGSEVRDDNANEICAKILLLAAEDPKRDIFLYINSPGGSITAGMAIYDTMKFVPNDIVTVGIGMAASGTSRRTRECCSTSRPAGSGERPRTSRPRRTSSST
jgi:ATP-dependent Clp protease protease subunit